MAKGILALLEPEKGSSSSDSGEKGMKHAGDDVEDAAADMIEAIGDKDPIALGLALRRAYEACRTEFGTTDEE